MDIFDQIAGARATQNHNRVSDGDYEWLVERIFMQKDRKNIDMYVAELRVMKSAQIEPDTRPNPVGELVGCAWKLDKDSSSGNIKAFLLALLGLNEATVSKEQMRQYTVASISGDGTTFRGIRLAGRTVRRVNQGRDNPENKGKVMTFPNFEHVPGQTEASIAQGRATLDAGVPAQPAAQTYAPPPAAPAPVYTPPAAPAAQTYAPPVSAAQPAPTPGALLGGLFGGMK